MSVFLAAQGVDRISTSEDKSPPPTPQKRSLNRHLCPKRFQRKVGWQNFGKCSVKYINENFKFSDRVKPDIAPGLPVLFLACDVVCLENEVLTLHWTYNSVSCSSLCQWRIDGMSVLHIQSLLGCLCTDSKSNPWHSYWPAHLWKIAWISGNKKAKNKKTKQNKQHSKRI